MILELVIKTTEYVNLLALLLEKNVAMIAPVLALTNVAVLDPVILIVLLVNSYVELKIVVQQNKVVPMGYVSL